MARLDLSAIDGEAAIVARLLADVLLRVNERVHGPEADAGAYLAHRLATLERFSDCPSAEEARQRFLPALNQLLVALEPDRAPRHRVVARAVDYIEAHYPRRLSLSSVASVLAVSPSYLSRAFRRDTGTTLTAYIQRVRIERAVALVAAGRHTLSEIAYRVGYQTYRDFHRNFVRREHESPRAMRERLARGPSPSS